MKKLHIVAMVGLVVWLSPAPAAAQLGFCMTKFADVLAAVDGATETNTQGASCAATRGAARVTFAGAVGVQTCNMVAQYLKLDQGLRKCQVFGQGTGCNFGNFVVTLPGPEAAQWNKFLRGQGCQDAMALVGP